MTLRWLGVAALAWVAAGCGDNSDQCGPGTTNVANVCVPNGLCGTGTMLDATGECVPDPSICGSGTIFDPLTSTCVLDPNSCQAGTIPVNGTCQDPTAGLVVDVEEAPEPNGYGFIESSLAPAGILPLLKPVGGSGIVVHGHLVPFQDADHDGLVDPDVDTYLLTTTGPAFVRIMADGVNGVTAGFTLRGVARPGYADYERTGLSLTSDFARRTVYLPAAGTYTLEIADTRTLLDPKNAPDGEYFITIDQLSVPAPTPLAIVANHGSTAGMLTGDETQFFSFAPGTGIDVATLTVPSSLVQGGLVAMRDQAFVGFAYGNNGVASCFGAGFGGQDELVVVDAVIAYTSQALPFTLDVATSDATPLPTAGTSASVVEQLTATPVTIADLLATSQFTFDATIANETIQLDLDWTHPVRGAVYDERFGLEVLQFTSLASAPTWSSYHGMIRVPHPGRYTFVVYDPAGTPGVTMLGVTSAVTPLTPTAITAGTPADVAIDAIAHRAAIVYSRGAAPWHAFDAVGTNTGGDTLTIYPDTMGRVEPLVTSSGTDVGLGAYQTHVYPEAGGAVDRIVLADLGTTYFMTVTPTTIAAAQSIHATFGPRAIVDLGTVAPGTPAVATGNPIDATNAPTFVLFRTASGNTATITVHPQAPAILDTRFHRLAADESAAGPVIDTSSNGDDSEQVVQSSAGWTALVVDAVTPPSSATAFDVTVSATAP